MKHRLLILGTLGEFVQLVKKSKERGYYTIVCDGYPDGPARQYADASYVIPVTDIDAVAELCQKEKVDGIITSFSDLLMECMVKIAEKAGLPCYLRPEQLCWYRDKSACRELLSKLGLPTPGFVKVPAAEQNEYKLAEITAGLKYPLISKPLDKYGSRGIFIIKDQEQLAGSVRKTAEFTDLDEILIEEYNDGFEFNMMTWVSDGKVNVISIADREKTQPEADMLPISTRNVYPSRLLSHVESKADLNENDDAHQMEMPELSIHRGSVPAEEPEKTEPEMTRQAAEEAKKEKTSADHTRNPRSSCEEIEADVDLSLIHISEPTRRS